MASKTFSYGIVLRTRGALFGSSPLPLGEVRVSSVDGRSARAKLRRRLRVIERRQEVQFEVVALGRVAA